jgi:hypothetical protein
VPEAAEPNPRPDRWSTASQPRRVPKISVRLGEQRVYPYQTKILEGGTRDEMGMFDTLFKVVSSLFGKLTIEKYVEHPHFITCSSFQNLRLGSIKLKKNVTRSKVV